MSAKVKIDDAARVVTTTFDDGTELTATPNDTLEDRARAIALGYVGVDWEDSLWQMTRHHDLIHTLLADVEVEGNDSIALWMAARPQTMFSAWHRRRAAREERIVLLIQRLLNEGPEAVARATGII